MCRCVMVTAAKTDPPVAHGLELADAEAALRAVAVDLVHRPLPVDGVGEVHSAPQQPVRRLALDVWKRGMSKSGNVARSVGK